MHRPRFLGKGDFLGISRRLWSGLNVISFFCLVSPPSPSNFYLFLKACYCYMCTPTPQVSRMWEWRFLRPGQQQRKGFKGRRNIWKRTKFLQIKMKGNTLAPLFRDLSFLLSIFICKSERFPITFQEGRTTTTSSAPQYLIPSSSSAVPSSFAGQGRWDSFPVERKMGKKWIREISSNLRKVFLRGVMEVLVVGIDTNDNSLKFWQLRISDFLPFHAWMTSQNPQSYFICSWPFTRNAFSTPSTYMLKQMSSVGFLTESYTMW